MGRESDLVCTDNEGDSTRGQVHVNHAARYIEDCLSQRQQEIGHPPAPTGQKAEKASRLPVPRRAGSHANCRATNIEYDETPSKQTQKLLFF